MLMQLKDVSLTINGYVASCQCKCNHCLLCSGDGKLPKIAFERLNELARRFNDVNARYGFAPSLCVYNCAEHPYLDREIDTNRYLSNPYAGYVSLNGTKIRKGTELRDWVSYLKSCGVVHANLSWFGQSEFHDQFVNAEGYYHYLIELAYQLKSNGIKWNNTIFILKSNIEQIDDLVNQLTTFGESLHFSLLDYRGNGKTILSEFLSEEDIHCLPSFLLDTGLFTRNRPEYEWVKLVENNQQPALSKRMMFLVVTEDNIDTYMSMDMDQILQMFHDIDARLQNILPSIESLCHEYGDSESQIVIDYRSVLWRWMDSYFEQNGLDKTWLFSDLHTSVMWR